jgi:hypothetical protein
MSVLSANATTAAVIVVTITSIRKEIGRYGCWVHLNSSSIPTSFTRRGLTNPLIFRPLDIEDI